jgi:hypothetical protein
MTSDRVSRLLCAIRNALLCKSTDKQGYRNESTSSGCVVPTPPNHGLMSGEGDGMPSQGSGIL